MENNRKRIWVYGLGGCLGLLLLGFAISLTLPSMFFPEPVTAAVEKPAPSPVILDHAFFSQEFPVSPNLSALIASWSLEKGVRKIPRRTPPLTPAQLEKLIKEYACRHGIDENLVKAVIRQESGFNSRAVSPKGAMGLMQLMPETAAMLGVADPFNVEQNVAGGVRYLRICLDCFGQDTRLALAAYNAGPANVVKHQGVPPFAETIKYVDAVSRDYAAQIRPKGLRGTPKNSPAAAGTGVVQGPGLKWQVPLPRWHVALPQAKVDTPRWRGRTIPRLRDEQTVASLPGKKRPGPKAQSGGRKVPDL